MKKMMKRIFASLLAFAMMFSTLTITAAAEEEEYLMFLAFGGDKEAENDWGFQYYGEGAGGNTGDVVGTVANAKVGDTVTIGLTFPNEVVYTWFMAPVLVAEGVGNVDYTVDKITIDGEDVTAKADMSIGDDAWWYEGTGDYSSEQSIRLKGGYNEWAAQALSESPKGFKEIMYTITINDISFGAAEGELSLSTDSYDAFIAFGGDKDAENDWGFQYYGSDAAGVTATNGTIKNGETTTLSLEFEKEVFYTWFTAPCMIVEDSSVISESSKFDVKVFLDDVEVTTDLSAGKACWAEATGDYAGEQCIRIGGGYNEWGDKYLAESPKGFKKISFEITPEIYVAAAAPESTAEPVDLNGKYNAYIGFQTPKFSFRNAWDEPTYGKGTDFFSVVTGWDADNNALTLPGSFTDVVIEGNGTYTVSAEGLSFPEGEFADQAYMNLIFISTDIPNSGEITFSDVELKVDGKSVDLPNGPIVDPDSKEVVKILLQNIWNNDCKEIGYYATPMENISITFTVSGFAYDKAAEAPVEEPKEDAATESAPAEEVKEESKSNTGLIVGIVAAAVVVVGGGAAVVVSKKKKDK